MSPIVMIALGILACVILYRVAQALSRPGARPAATIFSLSAPSAPTAAGAYSAFKHVVELDGGRKVVEAASEAHARREAEFLAGALATFQQRPVTPIAPNPTPPPQGG